MDEETLALLMYLDEGLVKDVYKRQQLIEG